MLRMTRLWRSHPTVAPVAFGRRSAIVNSNMPKELTWGRAHADEEFHSPPCRLPFSRLKFGAFSSTPVCFQQRCAGVPTACPPTFNVADVAYPPYSDDSVGLLVDAINKKRGNEPPIAGDHMALAGFITCWKLDDREGMALIHSRVVALIPKSDDENAMRILDEALSNRGDRANMPLVERDDFSDDMKTFIRGAVSHLQKTTLFSFVLNPWLGEDATSQVQSFRRCP